MAKFSTLYFFICLHIYVDFFQSFRRIICIDNVPRIVKTKKYINNF
jgi:hypothetical protein